MDPYKRLIRNQQDKMIERGVVPFLCKQISELEDEDIREECMLTCIALLIGGNMNAQDSFYQYMVHEDKNNDFL